MCVYMCVCMYVCMKPGPHYTLKWVKRPKLPKTPQNLRECAAHVAVPSGKPELEKVRCPYGYGVGSRKNSFVTE